MCVCVCACACACALRAGVADSVCSSQGAVWRSVALCIHACEWFDVCWLKLIPPPVAPTSFQIYVLRGVGRLLPSASSASTTGSTSTTSSTSRTSNAGDY